MDEEDAIIEQQLQEAQARIAHLKAQVAKERKMRLKLKKGGGTTSERSNGEMTGSASAPTLGGDGAGGIAVGANDEEKQRQNISAALSAANAASSKNSESKSGGPATATVGLSASQPALLQRPKSSSTSLRPAAGAGSAAVRGLSHNTPHGRPSTSNGNKRRRKKGHGRGRPSTASPSSSPARRTLSPVKFRPSEEHVSQAKNMSLKRLKELLADEIFQEAVKRKGIIDTQLHPRLPESFRRQSNRAALLSSDVAQLQFEAYESRRTDLLAMALQEYEGVVQEMNEEKRKLQIEQDKLAAVFETQVKGEDRRLQLIKEKTGKIQNVQLVENRLLKSRRKKFNGSKDKHENVHKAHLAKMKRDAELRAERGRRQQEKISQVSAMKDQMLAARAKQMTERFAERDARIEHAMRIKREENARRQNMASAGKDERSKRQAHATKIRKMRNQRLVARLHEKEQHVREVQLKKKQDLEALRVKKVLRMRRRIENADRARREAEYRNKVAVKKLQLSWARMDKMKEIDEAIRVQRNLQKKNDLIKRHKWIAETKLERSITPGPGEYTDKTNDMVQPGKGCKWGMHNPKSEIEWVIYHAKQVPGPGQYTPVDPKSLVTGGTWGKYTPKSDVEWKMLRASQLPGPGEYKPKEAESANMQAFGNFDPPSEIEKVIRRASVVPGPSDYASPPPPLRRPSMMDMKREFGTTAAAVGFIGKLKRSLNGARDRLKNQNEAAKSGNKGGGGGLAGLVGK
jgi:hypothetical protein